ncbi:sulfurtransferase [Tenacibaculum sp. TC6]|uniref:sulfurtransferase n=1 Tax=Tenacibaculum sp. TC6 TaxID=3423223 RepID=UPI003D36F7DB
MKLKIPNFVVEPQWLHTNLEAENLLILDATIPKVGTNTSEENPKKQIKDAVFFDIKNVFSNTAAMFPNTIPDAEKFEAEAQKLGVTKETCIVVYDDLGIYSSPRVWWLFKTFGFDNIAVLNGGLPAWIHEGYATETPQNSIRAKGDFKAEYHPENVKFTGDILDAIDANNTCILDARSKGRFEATQPEPRADLQGGHIPTSKNLPFTELQVSGKMKKATELHTIFTQQNTSELPLIFTCGSGITACILALGAELAGIKNYSVYDGSWTEWASTPGLPIEK